MLLDFLNGSLPIVTEVQSPSSSHQWHLIENSGVEQGVPRGPLHAQQILQKNTKTQIKKTKQKQAKKLKIKYK